MFKYSLGFVLFYICVAQAFSPWKLAIQDLTSKFVKSEEPQKTFTEQNWEDWEAYKTKFNKACSNKKEEIQRLTQFVKTQELVNQHNLEYERGEQSYKMGLNHLADFSESERKRLSGYRTSKKVHKNVLKLDSTNSTSSNSTDLPDSIDWRDLGYVSSVKNQENCGSCWAFSAAGALEGQRVRSNRTLISLSPQNLVDCSTDYDNQGCDGGDMDSAFDYIIDNDGIDTDKSYPYKAYDDDCHYKKKNVGAKMSKFVDITEGDEQALKEAVATQGPISVAIDSDHSGFNNYQSGVYYQKHCKTANDDLDHAVLVVGYGTDKKGGDYWIVKNSWGAYWGEDGYIKMARNRNNNCGIATAASYPLI